MSTRTSHKSKARSGYIISLGVKNYNVSPEIFLKMSTKFQEIYKQDPNEYQVIETIRPEDFDIFIDACQLKNFSIEKRNAFQVLDLAKAWGVPSLEKYINTYIEKNKLVRKEVDDYVGILCQHIEENTDCYTDWSNVAQILPEILDDPRMLEIPPEVFSRILSIADKSGFDLIRENRLKLINYTMKLLDVHQENAIPIVLRLDFSEMTDAQVDQLYNCKKLQEQNIGFFLEAAISALQNKTDFAIEKSMLLNDQIVSSTIVEHQKNINDAISEMNDLFDRDVEEIVDEIDRQQDILDELKEHLNNHVKKLARAEEKAKERLVILPEDEAARMQQETNNQINEMTVGINERLNEHLKTLHNQSIDGSNVANEFFTRCARESINEVDVSRNALEELITFGEQIRQHEEAIIDDLRDVKALVAAKVVRDKLRFDQFLRRTTGKYKVFEEDPKPWGLSTSAVSDADKKLAVIEKKLDEICPLRKSK
ncbi:hypothetical protein TVAG_395640 [Trichomonas vaginalis G3]|uniref:Uncharacterized protein n=1 Tax=Trichomonas vaginalis (strain ATCC PRA-98 / G3) TaxID=412133 RepID=A2FX40_TRIV3|nr:hypothetical protein TVAGG3_0902150 [Trichomonas vaginalis G3]EAX90518.1 hypothetical protein TVAG_395640 [Trichomonas vaginalis G3]KAI5483768.1 hypothetical protein TVAGG3_0902150 [Trichomonas vaginalis G3]|eukprot:XP_001303448.1 hypothetical protein [Trichomonas vaginalis G3]